MENENIINKFGKEIADYLPTLSVDCVVMGYKNDELYALVLKFKKTDIWSLPGGFVKQDEDLDQAAFRVLKDRTGLDISFLRQLHVFGERNRRDIEALMRQLDNLNANTAIKNWFKQRFISVAYLALVNPESFTPIPDHLSESCEWKPIKEMPELLFDHGQMIDKAKEYIGVQIKYLPVGLSLLPEKFTMKTLQKLYEVVLGRTLDRANFQKKMLKLRILIRHEKQMSGGAHKAPFLYSFDKDRYHESLISGIGFLS